MARLQRQHHAPSVECLAVATEFTQHFTQMKMGLDRVAIDCERLAIAQQRIDGPAGALVRLPAHEPLALTGSVHRGSRALSAASSDAGARRYSARPVRVCRMLSATRATCPSGSRAAFAAGAVACCAGAAGAAAACAGRHGT